MAASGDERASAIRLDVSLDDLVERARSLTRDGRRRILGIAGAPGAGKSTVSAEIARALGSKAALVGMDGFHLANDELDRLGRRERKGAADTFDSFGYADLLGRLRDDSRVIYAPTFDRALDQSIGSAVAVLPSAPLIITEGNYLLVGDDESSGWTRARGLLDEIWYIDVSSDERRHRLVARHRRFGKSTEAAENWVDSVDQRNGAVVEATAHRADYIMRLTDASS